MARLRDRFRVVLVDEFQDTDPVQWDIVSRAFGEGGTLVLIGDPKQAIYAFRGADVYAYLDAASSAGARETLDVNWRSDEGLLEAYDALFANARLGHEGIVYRSVRATHGRRLQDAPRDAPLRFRVVDREDPTIELTYRGFASNDSTRRHIAKDLAGDLVTLLSSGATVDGEPVEPGHVAVLVRTHRQAGLVREALDAVDVPAVINGAGSVFGSDPARHWLQLLEAIERPTSPARARAAALTPFLGWDAERVATAADAEWEEVHRRLHEWARVLRLRGVAALVETITLVERLPARLLSLVDGERAADRPAPRRPAPARGGRRRAARSRRADVVAAPADRRRRAGDRRRGAQPPAGVRPGGGAGPHHPPQQGAGVPDRLPPVPVGADVDLQRQAARLLPRPRRRRRAHDRRRARRPRLPAPPAPARDRAARRGPAAGLRRAHPRQAPGDRLVGGDREQPRLRALAPAVRARRGRQRLRARAVDADRPRRRHPAARAGVRAHQRRALDAGGPAPVGAAGGRSGRRSRRRRSRARWTGAGGAPRSATSPRAPTRRAWPASRRRR